MIKRAIVWFKTDLRLHDNETLVRAIALSDEVVPVYCFDPAHFTKTSFNFQKTGTFRLQFLLESLKDLDDNLRKVGSGLIILNGKPEIEIGKIAHQFGAKKVFAKREVAYEELNTEARVEAQLWQQNITFDTFSTSTLYHAQDLPFTIRDIPDVFTNFRKQVERESTVRPVFGTPSQIKSPPIPSLILPNIEDFGCSITHTDDRAAINFKGGETQALARIHHYLYQTKAIANYKNTRNGLIGADYSTKFSAWLALGCVSARKIYKEIKQFEQLYKANDSTYWVVFELIWRDYFRFMMKKYKHKFFLENGIKNETFTNYYDFSKINKWINGQTGDDFVDANMNELRLTGFMSNRGRQNVASYFCNELKQDWRYGAAYFEQQLIDYDVSSNWGNWAYIAGVGNDPRPDRVFNTQKQAQIYDTQSTFRNLWK